MKTYVGAVNGIGLALFAYLSRRCGADAMKPDTRVATPSTTPGSTSPTVPTRSWWSPGVSPLNSTPACWFSTAAVAVRVDRFSRVLTTLASG